MQSSTLNKIDNSPIPLRELLPLRMPLVIHIDPVNVCNFKCTFCPTGDDDLLTQIGRPKGSMSFELYTKIIDDIHEMSKITGAKLKRLHLYKDGEPLLNKNIGKMVAYAKTKQISESVETTTNGAALTEKIALELIRCGLDAIRISVEHVTNEGYKAITKTFGDYDKIKKNVSFLYQAKKGERSNLKILAKIVDAGISEEDKKKFIEDFTPISDSLKINQLMGWSKSGVMDWKLGRDVSTGMDGLTPVRNKVVCPEPFSKLAVNFDGTVSVCCVDWSHETLVGDLNTQSLSEIWNGKKLRNFRLLHLEGKRGQLDPCANCDYQKGFPEYTNLDDDRGRLLQMYLEK